MIAEWLVVRGEYGRLGMIGVERKQVMRLSMIVMHGVLALSPVAVTCAQDAQQTPEEKRAAVLAYRRSFECGATFLREPPDVVFIDVDFEKLPKLIKSHMYSVLTNFLARESRPQATGDSYAPGRMTVRVFGSRKEGEDDLVEYRWTVMGQNLRVVASQNAARLDIDLDELLENPSLAEFGRTEVARAAELLEHTLRMRGRPIGGSEPYELHIGWPDTLTEGMRFSTNPDKVLYSMAAERWFERVDFFIRNRTLSVMGYFKLRQLMGPQDGSKWFPDEFRAEIHERTRRLGDLSPESEAEEE